MLATQHLLRQKRCFCVFYSEEVSLAKAFARAVQELHRDVCMAELQNHLLRYRGDALLAVSQVNRDLQVKTKELT